MEPQRNYYSIALLPGNNIYNCKNRRLNCMKKNLLFFVVLLSFLKLSNYFAADTTIVQSPDAKIFFKLFQQDHQLTFKITFQGQTVIEPSPIVMSVDGKSLAKNVTV